MAYVPFDPSYTPIRTPAYVAAESQRWNARRTLVGNAIDGGNQLMGDLITNCACNDPAYGGQAYYPASTADASGSAVSSALAPTSTSPTVAGNGAPGVSSSAPDTAALISAASTFALTPVDILTGTYGFPIRRDGRAWRQPRLPGREGRRRANAYPNGPAYETSRLVPPCPCFSKAPPIPIPVPVVAAPPPPPPPPAPCPYPKCSTGNVCLDLVNGCVLNSQVDTAQQTACALANYGVFGNRGTWLGAIIHDCPSPPFLGTPMPNPPPADPSMMALLNSKGLSGFGQVDLTGGGGLLAVLAMFGIVVWAIKK